MALIALCVIFTILLQSNTPIKAFIGSTFLTALVYAALRLSYSSAKEENKVNGRTFDKSTAILVGVLIIVLGLAFYLGGGMISSEPHGPYYLH
ncbi:hypothetical protein [Dyadobacter sp. SG02]|uniref:hypothetical protein n=1 Tax=Dyadobacter sp. SG02 TaxID=1855291 RepID=UPI00115F8569|nr:hypothetical protein [Dyadobacter sp. SG02]